MSLLLTGGSVYFNDAFRNMDVAIADGRIVSIAPSLPQEGYSVVQLDNNCLVVPGFVDVHVHLREPGFSYKETITSGTKAAAAGGYTVVCSMPNLKPVPDSVEHLEEQLELIRKGARVKVYPLGAITCNEMGKELADLEGMAPHVAGFSDDGRGVQSPDVMRKAMGIAKALNKPIVAHCEDESLLTTWCIHNGEFARRNGFPGNDPASEWKQVERDIELVRETGCQYHVCHISTKESVALIRAAKAEGLPVSCETGPHYLVMCDEDLQDDGRFRMNPPIRSAEDRDALVAGLLDGTVDCIATDHAPHSAEEKAKGLRGSLNGIVGLETAFPILYTQLVQPGIVPMETVLQAMCVNPRKLFDLPGGLIAEGEIADLTVLDLNRPGVVNSATFQSLGHATPFEGWCTSAAVALTVCDGKIVYSNLNNQEALYE